MGKPIKILTLLSLSKNNSIFDAQIGKKSLIANNTPAFSTVDLTCQNTVKGLLFTHTGTPLAGFTLLYSVLEMLRISLSLYLNIA